MGGLINVSVAMAEKAQAAIVDLCEKLGIAVATKTEPQLRLTLQSASALLDRVADSSDAVLTEGAETAKAAREAVAALRGAAEQVAAVGAEAKGLVAKIKELVAIVDPNNVTVTTPTGAVWRIQRTKEGDSSK